MPRLGRSVAGFVMWHDSSKGGRHDFKESEVTIKARLKTVPIQQWAVGREYRRRLKKAFDARGIEIPFPHRSLYVGTATGPLEVMLRQGSGADNGVPVPAPTS